MNPMLVEFSWHHDTQTLGRPAAALVAAGPDEGSCGNLGGEVVLAGVAPISRESPTAILHMVVSLR
jgi:hypothetical protein